MPNNPLFHPVSGQSTVTNFRDQIQIALAIADSHLLKSLLTNCIPAIAPSQHIGAVSSEVSVPTGNHQSADGVLQFESVRYLLANPQPQQNPSPQNHWMQDPKELARLTQHESALHTLGQNLALAPAIALLASAHFCPEQINDILRLPHHAWYKSWWYGLDCDGNFTHPFVRSIRTLNYPDGTLTLQYKDFFAQEKPDCFMSVPQKVLVAIYLESRSFGETLEQINYQRERLNIRKTVLICDTLSELTAQAFINQGVSVFPATELLLPIQADCLQCARQECPMNGNPHSLVASCYGFLVESEYV